MKTCNNCGSDCKEIERNGEIIYKCACCGATFAKVEAKPAPVAPAPAAPSAPAKPNVLSGEEIYDKMQGVAVEIYVQNDNSAARASGFFITSTGLIITNAHAVLDSNGSLFPEIYVKVGDKYYRSLVVACGAPSNGKDDSLDIALIYSPDLKGSDIATLGDSSKLRNGQKVYLIGNSLGAGTCITSGIISDAKRKMPGLSYPYIMTDAAANHGNSGGPLLNEMGDVIGVLVAGVENAKGMNYAIPINIVKEFIAYVKSKTNLKRSVLGEVYSVLGSNMSTVSGPLRSVKFAFDVIDYINK
ncbi:MAG: trypsin-like peptidase domain-containing protein [Clostridia bacterium]|nr:trypsin-like peptidase domain-containing protein [Clostridia bacterium]